jgi:enoyl-CoA hydratase/carnithine racemase
VEHVSLREHEDGVRVMTIDRPPANAMDVALLAELCEAVERVAGDPPRALVLSGRPGFFSGGADLKAVPGYGADDQRAMVTGINAMALGVYGLPCPVVGAITGHAIAGGLVLALCTDLRVASSDGKHGLTEIKVGVPYPQAAIGVVRAELAPHAARLLAFGNQLLSAAQCLALGVYDEVVEPDAVLPRSLGLARELASFPAEVYARTKHDLRGTTAAALREAAESDPLLAQWVTQSE